MKLSTFIAFMILMVKVKSDPNPFHYPKYVLDRIIDRAIEAEVNSEFPNDDAKYHNDDGGEFKQEINQFKSVVTNEYDDSPNAAKKVKQNAQQDQNQRDIPQEIIRKKFLENFFDVEKVPEEVIKKSKTVLTKLQEPGSENDYYNGDDYSGDLYSSYKDYPYDSYNKKSEQLKNEYSYVSPYNKKSEELKNENDYPYDSYYKESEELKKEKSDEDKEEVEDKKPKESFFLQEYSSGYNQEWNGKDSDQNYVPDKKEN